MNSRRASRVDTGQGLTTRELFFLVPASDLGSEQVRAAQIDALVRLLPFTSAISLLNAAMVAASLFGSVPTAQLALWLGVMVALSALRVVRTRARHARNRSGGEPSVPLKSVLTGVVIAAALWTVPALLWFDGVGANEKLMIAVVALGMMSGASITLATVPPAAFAYVWILSLAMLWAEAKLGTPLLAVTAFAYGLILCGSSLWFVRQFAAHCRARLDLGEKSEMIELLREFDASGGDWMWELDPDCRLTYVSREMVSQLGVKAGDLIGVRIQHLLDPTGRTRQISTGVRTLFDHLDGALMFRDLVVPTAGGKSWWSLSGKRQFDQAGQCTGWRGVGFDVTQVRLSGSDAVRAARRDPMTGIANRLMIREQLEEALMKQEAGAGACSLLLVDLDRFKLVNDTLGHAVGDQLLCEVAQRLEGCAGDQASVGRLGGDEFAILLISEHQDADLAELAECVITRLSEPYWIGGAELAIGATIGIATSPRDGRSQEELTRSADLALYRAKEAGRGSFQFFDAAMLEEAHSKRQLESELRTALQAGELTLAYQPIVDAGSGEVVGKEALLRWNHPQRGPLSPDLFVPLIEDTGLIGTVGNWVIRQACEDAKAWPSHMRVAVNVSAAQLAGCGLAGAVVAALGSSCLAPERLELEVTESIFMADDSATLDSLDRLRQLGVQLVIDDFGTGYSSFGYLARARFHKIKIAKSFVHAVAEGSRQAGAIVEAIIALAHGLDMTITAEGVERPDQAAAMRALGCDLLQGFLFGRPAERRDSASGVETGSSLVVAGRRRRAARG